MKTNGNPPDIELARKARAAGIDKYEVAANWVSTAFPDRILTKSTWWNSKSKPRVKKKRGKEKLERAETLQETERRKDKARERYAAKKDTQRDNPPAIVMKADGGVEINYCPKCGCNVKAVRNALSVALFAEGVTRG